MTSSTGQATSPQLSNALARGIVNEWKESVLVLDQDQLVTFANQAFCDWVGVAWPSLAGRPFQDVLGSPQAADFLHEVQCGSPVRNLQLNCEVPEIGKRGLLLSANLLLGSKPQAILVGIEDITNQNLSNSALSRSVEVAERAERWQRREAGLLRSVLESSGEGIFVSDMEGNCVLSNRACEQMLGVKPESLKHLRQGQWSEAFGAYLDDKETPFPVEDLPLSRALRGESCDDVELWIRNKARPEGLWISVNARPLTGEQTGAISTFRDITFAKGVKEELAARAEEVARSNRELEQFAYVAAHDLQEPLRMVSSYVQLLSRRYKGQLDAEADEFIAFATDGAKRMSRLINDLLTYSRVGRGEVPEQLVDCEKVLEQVLYNLTQKNLAAGVEVSHDPLPQIMANEVQITQVFQNLIDNAIKFRSKDDPRVHLSARTEGDRWIFSVADNGIGIDAQYKDRVFVIFQRLNSREAYDGTGIGLAVCKKIVEKRDGDIWVEPNQGHGTIVYFTWP
jgi:PAS domain S-box-containing protein